jgi:hypothetical protein
MLIGQSKSQPLIGPILVQNYLVQYATKFKSITIFIFLDLFFYFALLRKQEMLFTYNYPNPKGFWGDGPKINDLGQYIF